MLTKKFASSALERTPVELVSLPRLRQGGCGSSIRSRSRIRLVLSSSVLNYVATFNFRYLCLFTPWQKSLANLRVLNNLRTIDQVRFVEVRPIVSNLVAYVAGSVRN